MNIRTVTGFLAGCFLWWFFFLAVGIGFGMLWPAYREAAHVLFTNADSSHFTISMFLLNFLVFFIAGMATGWLATFISKSRSPALIVALLYLVYTVFEHYYLAWDKLPHWYNLIVPFVISGSIAMGSRLTRTAAPSGNRNLSQN